MTFVTPGHSKGEVNRAGKILVSGQAKLDDLVWAYDVLTNWRAAHGYPINTFQATLRNRLKIIDKNAIVAQRLKRTPSILSKLSRFDTMNLARMQDIGGLRAIVGNISQVRKLEKIYREGKLQHTLVHSKDYISHPKDDGYRGIHLIFKYENPRAEEYNGLHLELQMRTRKQHAWATAVETMGTFLGQALKSGQGEKNWMEFFSLTSSAIAVNEKSPPIPTYAAMTRKDLFLEVAKVEKELKVLEKLRSFSIAANQITQARGTGAYHLVTLNSGTKTVSIKPFSTSKLQQATEEYALIEKRIQEGDPLEVVLVSAGSVDNLRKAYPNYFLDTHGFILEVERMLSETRVS